MLFRLASATAAAILTVSSVVDAQVLTNRDVSLRMALNIAEAALAECGTTTSVAVVDRAGRVRVLLQGDNASPHNMELARRKAYTARTFRPPSSVVGQAQRNRQLRTADARRRHPARRRNADQCRRGNNRRRRSQRRCRRAGQGRSLCQRGDRQGCRTAEMTSTRRGTRRITRRWFFSRPTSATIGIRGRGHGRRSECAARLQVSDAQFERWNRTTRARMRPHAQGVGSSNGVGSCLWRLESTTWRW